MPTCEVSISLDKLAQLSGISMSLCCLKEKRQASMLLLEH